jgi:DNA-binding CsgD family transcriptional regulator
VAETEQVAADRDGAARHPHSSGTRADDGAGFRASPEDAVLTDPIGAADKDGSSKRFDRLTKRHRECLRGVRELKGSKEIADDLGIEKSTVDGYLTEAVKVLGARNRRDAAMQLAEHEASLSEPSDWNNDVSSPDKMGGHSARLFEQRPPLSLPISPDESIVGAAGASVEPWRDPRSLRSRLPFRREGQRANDLSVGDRVIWIQAIALSIAIGFGMLMTGLQVLTDLIEKFAQRLS